GADLQRQRLLMYKPTRRGWPKTLRDCVSGKVRGDFHKLTSSMGKTGGQQDLRTVGQLPRDTRVRSGLWSLGCRGYNVKLLKLHGSMNWLQCPNCQRLFVQFGGKQEILEHLGNTVCRHCKRFGHENYLAGSLVMPTFLKDLSNFQIKLVWQNAGVE